MELDEVMTLPLLLQVPHLGGQHEDEEVRAQALKSLSRLKEPSASALLNRALADPDAQVRLAAIQGLGALGEASAIPTLVQVASAPRTEGERTCALEALWKLAARGAADAKPPQAPPAT